MEDEIIVRKEVQDWLELVGSADLLVGIPSFNNAGTIGHVVRAVQAGLAKYFPDCKAVLVNSDGGSSDGTRDVVENSAIDDFQQILIAPRVPTFFKTATLYSGIPGKGSAFRTIFEIAEALQVKACAVVDSDLRSITPEWIELLIKPVYEGGFDYVAPLYQRHKFDGTITNSIVYPLTRALYGRSVRQPIGGDFGFSGRLAGHYLSQDVWESDVARFGIDIWMTTTALAGDFRVCQSFLGAKIHDAKDPGADLSAMLFQVVSATFDMMERYYDTWSKIEGATKVPVFGFEYAVGLEPVSVNLERMMERFCLGVHELLEIWQIFLPAETIDFLCRAARRKGDDFRFPDEEWVTIIYHFALAQHNRLLAKEHLLKSLTPLYIGKVASFVMEMRDSTSAEVEERLSGLCREFEKQKPLLLEKWV